jgi:hypothetical protein
MAKTGFTRLCDLIGGCLRVANQSENPVLILLNQSLDFADNSLLFLTAVGRCVAVLKNCHYFTDEAR